MVLQLPPVKLPVTTAHLTCHFVVATAQPKHHGHWRKLLAVQTTCQFLSSSTKESHTNHSSQGRPGGVAMALTGPVWPTRLNRECSNFQRSLLFPSISHDSTTSSNLQSHFMSAEPNGVRNLSLESIHTSQQRSAIATVSVVLYIKSGRNGWMLVKKQKWLSAKPRPIAGQPRCMESHLRPQQHTRYQLAQWSHVL